MTGSPEAPPASREAPPHPVAASPRTRPAGRGRRALWGGAALAWALLLALPALPVRTWAGGAATGADEPVVEVFLDSPAVVDAAGPGRGRVRLVATVRALGDTPADLRVRTLLTAGASTRVLREQSLRLPPGAEADVPATVDISCAVRNRVAVDVSVAGAPEAVVHAWVDAATRPGTPQEGLTCPQR